MKTKTMHHITRTLLLAAALSITTRLAAAEAVTNWAAFNDYVPSATTHPNANVYNLRGVAGTPPEPVAGFLKDFVTGAPTPAYIIAEATGAPDFFGAISYPNAGTPAYNLFNGIVDLGNNNSAIGIRSSANTTVTLTFSNLNPSQRYIFRGTAVRGNSYVRRWTLASLRGAASFTDAHTMGVYTMANFPTGTMTNGQAAYNSGENRAEGALVGWDNIDPGPDGVFTIKCEQYVDTPLPNGQTPDLGAYGYAFAGIYLAEVGAPTPAMITANPPANVTIEQDRALNLTANAQGAPAPTFQWYKGNVEVPGATARTYYVTNAQPSDSGDYYVVAVNSLNRATSTVSHVTVFLDTNGPVLLSAKADDSFQRITLRWNEPVSPGPASESGSYTIQDPSGNAVDVLSIDYFGTNVVLRVAPLLRNTNYQIEIDYQSDNRGNLTKAVGTPVNDDNGIVTNIRSWAITPGLTRFDAYLNLPAGETIGQFVASPAYSNSPSFSFYTNILNWPQSVPNLDQYVMRFTGLYVATESGTHIFDPAHDDDARLRIYASDDPLGTFTELLETGTSGFGTAASATTTLSVDLVAGSTYYYEFIVREFGGGDIAGLEVRTPTTTNSPITSEHLAAAADPTLAPNFGISVQPQGQTIAENHSATLSVTVTNAGGGVAYQWQRQPSGGGGFVNIAGAVGSSYTTPLLVTADNGAQYRVIISAPGRTITSSPATLNVIVDTVAPRVVAVRGTGGLNAIRVTFDEALSAGSATEAGNYTLTDTNGLNPLNLGVPTLSADLRTVTIPTDPQAAGRFYRLSVQDVSDIAGNFIVPTNVTFQTWINSRGFVLKELYLGLSASSVAISDLRASPKYPNSPDIVRYGDSLELNTFDEFEGYGARLSGLLIPPVSGNYVFYLSSDDNGELWLSTNSSPTNISLIAKEPVYAGRRVWTGESAGGSRLTTPSPSGGPAANISGAINLVAGQAYYFEALMKEGGGGDNLAVTWQAPGQPVPVNGAAALSAAFSAVLADPVGAAIAISQQPASLNATQGQVGTFVITATGTNASGSAPLAYQWQRLVGGVFTDIAGATSSNYVTAALSNPDNGSQYRALVFIPGASATSAVATVTIGGGAPTLRSTYSNGTLTLSWDAPARLQFTTSLNAPINWRDLDLGGATSYAVVLSNQFSVNLDSAQENNPADTSTAIGSGTITLSNNVLVVDVVYSGLSADRSADHFHAPGARGASAGVAYDLGTITTGVRAGTVKGLVPLVDNKYGSKNIAAQIQDIRNSLWYLNIHSVGALSGGEIRGQVEPGARFYRLVSP